MRLASTLASSRLANLRGWRRAAAAALLCGGFVAAGAAAESEASALRARHAALREQLAASPFKRPLHLTSAEASGKLRGDVDAALDQPFPRVAQALAAAESWCEVLILQPNVKQCRVEGNGAVRQLSVNVGKSFDEPLEDTKLVRFDHRVVASTADFLKVALTAKEGPLGTRDYDILLEAAPLEGGRTAMHFAYSYGYGAMAKIAMQAYLSTSGRDKVGFSVAVRDGESAPIGGVRGAVERNTMRYQLAIEAVLASLALPAAEQPEARLRHWMAGIANHPRQLAEANPTAFAAAKRRDIQRQKQAAS